MSRDRLALLDPKADDETIDGFLTALGVSADRGKAQDYTKGEHGYFTGSRPGGAPQSIAELEAKIQTKTGGETAYLVSPDGKILVDKSHDGQVDGGRSYGVDFTPEELARARGGILVHNHPSGWDYPPDDPRRAGNSFSPADVGLAIENDLGEIRAITPTRRFILRPGPDGWNLPALPGLPGEEATGPRSLALRYRSAEQAVERSVRARFTKRIDEGYDPWGATTAERIAHADIEHFDTIWREMAEKYGWIYIEEPAPSEQPASKFAFPLKKVKS